MESRKRGEDRAEVEEISTMETEEQEPITPSPTEIVENNDEEVEITKQDKGKEERWTQRKKRQRKNG
jgi:hypothetical protein